MNSASFFSGKVALITGAARGIGLATAHELGNHGCSIALQDLDETEAARQVERLASTGIHALALGGNLKDLSIAPLLIQKTIAKFRRLDFLINNGAVQIGAPWETTTETEIQEQMSINQMMPFRLCQEAIPFLRKNPGSAIVNIGSIMQERSAPGLVAYGMTKSALENLTKSLAFSLGSEGIRVNLVAPGIIHTERNLQSFPNEESRRAFSERRIPLNRFGTPEECANVIAFLCSPEASYVTGSTVWVDGGYRLNKG